MLYIVARMEFLMLCIISNNCFVTKNVNLMLFKRHRFLLIVDWSECHNSLTGNELTTLVVMNTDSMTTIAMTTPQYMTLLYLYSCICTYFRY